MAASWLATNRPSGADAAEQGSQTLRERSKGETTGCHFTPRAASDAASGIPPSAAIDAAQQAPSPPLRGTALGPSALPAGDPRPAGRTQGI